MASGTLGRLAALLVVLGAGLSSAEMVTRRWGKAPGGRAARSDQVARPTGYAPKVPAGPEIDGKLDDPCWRKAPVMALARTLDNAGEAARPTEVRAVRDARNLYVAFRCVEPAADKVRAGRRSHDGEIWSDDSVEMFLGLGATYYHFGVNAAGSTYDGKVKDSAWNSGFKAATARGPKEWTVELSIPLAKVTGPGTAPAAWAANFNRNRYTEGTLQESAWSPTLSGNSHVPERFGKLLLAAPPAKPDKEKALVEKGSVTILPAAEGKGVVRFDLTALAKGTTVHRADLLIFRSQPVTGRDDEALVDVEVYALLSDFKAGDRPAVGAKPLRVRGPWFDRLDATEAVRQWVAGKTNGGFFVKACPFIDLARTCLDVAYEGTPTDVPPQVTAVDAFHRAGQTFITWKEIDDPVGTDEVRWGRFRQILEGLDRKRRLRYCVYRSAKPVTAASLHQAERIAVVAPLSGWNVNGRNVDKPIDHALGHQYALRHHQWNPFVGANVEGKFGLDCLMERLVVHKSGKPLPRGTGLYVHSPGKEGKAYYAVVTSVDGVENTADLSQKNSPPQPVRETAGQGEPVLQKQFPPKPYFNYKEKRLHYVRWVHPPYVNVPSQYYNWSVAVPAQLSRAGGEAGKPAPLELSLHRDGRSYYRTQYRVEQDSIVITPHDFPVKTWWYGYHESLGTLKSFRQGRIHNYTERRLLAFIDWAARKWPVDRNRILVTGCRGGAAGSGALHLGIRHPDVFNLVLSGYGFADYAGEMAALIRVKRAGAMPAQMESIWGQTKWGLKTDTGKNVWDELNLTKLVLALPDSVHLPLVSVTGHGMLKPMRDFYAAMLDKGQAVMARYGVYGGGTLLPVSRTGNWSRMIRQDLRRDQIMPAFWGHGCSALWVEPKAPSGELVVSDGIKRWWGVFNTGYRWKTDDIVDKPTRIEITLFWGGSQRVRKPHADVTLRRVQNFRIRPNWAYTYEVRNAAGEVVEQDKVTPGKAGLFVIKGVHIPREGSRLIIRP